MSFLDNLTDNQRDTLISLPYRVGLWVSQSDISGGDDSSGQERQVLANIIHGVASDMFGSEVVQIVMTETIKNKDQWPKWAQQSSAVPEDCAFAMDVIRQYADAKDATAFKNHLMEIGEAVALAFREYDQMGFGQKLSLYIAYLSTKFKARPKSRPRRTLREYLSISPGERKALMTLAQSLGTTYV